MYTTNVNLTMDKNLRDLILNGMKNLGYYFYQEQNKLNSAHLFFSKHKIYKDTNLYIIISCQDFDGETLYRMEFFSNKKTLGTTRSKQKEEFKNYFMEFTISAHGISEEHLTNLLKKKYGE